MKRSQFPFFLPSSSPSHWLRRLAATAARRRLSPQQLRWPILRRPSAGNEVVADAAVVPARNADLSLPTGGIVAEILAQEGQQVEQGAPILRLESARQQAAVAQADAGLAAAQARLAELKSGARSAEIDAAQAAVDAARRKSPGSRPAPSRRTSTRPRLRSMRPRLTCSEYVTEQRNSR